MKIHPAVLLACVMSQADGQQTAPPVSSIRVMGEAVVSARPDRAQLDVGVLTQAPKSQPAAQQNAQQLERVMTALHKVLGPGADIETINYSVNPNYRYPPNGEQPTITGYTATNIVRVTLDDLEKVGTVIDAATQAGANHVESVRFTVRDPEAIRTRALRDAAQKARSEADALAAALNLKIVRVLSAEESRAIAGPLNSVPVAAYRSEAASAPTPIQSGTIDVEANVSLTVEAGPR